MKLLAASAMMHCRRVAPAARSGRGLKRCLMSRNVSIVNVAPAARSGRGLKPIYGVSFPSNWKSPRPHGRGAD